jgi:tetratricopeptide (TPR) repeat protein
VAGNNLDDLMQLAKDARGQPLSAVSIELLAVALYIRGARVEAVALLRDARSRHPADFWIHLYLGGTLHDPAHPDPATLDEVLGCMWAAVALRPSNSPAHTNLGLALHRKGLVNEAIEEFRKAIDLDPKLAKAHLNLGLALHRKGLVNEAIACYRRAIEIDPRYALAHDNLGLALLAKGLVDEAIACFRTVLEIEPKYAQAHYSLGIALEAKGRLDEAIAAYRQAIKFQPDYAEAHCNLGQALRQRGDFADALAVLKRGHQLGSKRKDWRYPSAQWVEQCEGLLALDGKLPAILKGDAQPADNQERLQLADLCRVKKRYVAAVGFFTDAFATEPKLTAIFPHRYNAARAAACAAAAGKGGDAAGLGAKDHDPLRKQARDWLEADLKAWAGKLDGKPAKVVRDRAAAALHHWRDDADLLSVRHPWALVHLPADERRSWQQLWADVEALRKKAAAE